jgi:hypothetical protein
MDMKLDINRWQVAMIGGFLALVAAAIYFLG